MMLTEQASKTFISLISLIINDKAILSVYLRLFQNEIISTKILYSHETLSPVVAIVSERLKVLVTSDLASISQDLIPVLVIRG